MGKRWERDCGIVVGYALRVRGRGLQWDLYIHNITLLTPKPALHLLKGKFPLDGMLKKKSSNVHSLWTSFALGNVFKIVVLTGIPVAEGMAEHVVVGDGKLKFDKVTTGMFLQMQKNLTSGQILHKIHATYMWEKDSNHFYMLKVIVCSFKRNVSRLVLVWSRSKEPRTKPHQSWLNNSQTIEWLDGRTPLLSLLKIIFPLRPLFSWLLQPMTMKKVGEWEQTPQRLHHWPFLPSRCSSIDWNYISCNLTDPYSDSFWL